MKKQMEGKAPPACTEDSTSQDAVWETAWTWVRRQHESNPLDAASQQEFVQWLDGGKVNQRAYEKACRLWLVAGLVPPANDVPVPGCDDGEA